MKKKLILLIAAALVLSLFAGCRTDGPEPGTTPTGGGGVTEPPEEEMYNFANGKYQVNEQGFPTAPYDYELPISTTDEVLSFWTVVWSPQHLPEEGYGSMDFPEGERELTGVNIEYVVVPFESRAENYSILLNSDDLCDIMTQATAYHPGTYEDAIEDGFWVNLYDYIEYMPNYIYQATFDPDDELTYETVFYDDDMIVAFYSMLNEALIGSNYLARGDWLADMGKTNDDIVTWDDLHEMLVGYKANVETCQFPFPLLNTLDMGGLYAFTSFDTLPYVDPFNIGPVYIIDGKVQHSHITERDREFITMINSWYNEGLIDPGWSNYSNNTNYTDKTVTGQVGYIYGSPGEVPSLEAAITNDGDASFVPIKKPLKEPGQTIHLGGEVARISYGSSTISATCENIPLAVTWCDWRYSPAGSFYASWGPEGILWEKDENGNPIATEWALSNPNGLAYAWACMLYAINSLAEHGMEDGSRKYAFDGGERLEAIHYYWADYKYDGAYSWPVGINFTAEQTDEINSYASDIVTYISENYLAFVDNSKPLSEWDDYVAGISALKLDRVLEIYQEAYDAYMAEKNEEAPEV